METVDTGSRLEALRKLMVENKVDIYGMASPLVHTGERGEEAMVAVPIHAEKSF